MTDDHATTHPKTMTTAHADTAADTAAATTADHAAVGDDHGAGHGHGEAEVPLGPVDVVAWGAGLLGVLLGGVTALAFALSTGLLDA
jgi:hypothetical protein